MMSAAAGGSIEGAVGGSMEGAVGGSMEGAVGGSIEGEVGEFMDCKSEGGSSGVFFATGGQVVTTGPNILEELQNVFVQRRLEVVNEEGFLTTPLHIVKKMAEEHNLRIHKEIYVVSQAGSEEILERIEMIIGQARGFGQAPVRQLAVQLAAIDILEKIKFYNQEPLPVYGLPPGTLIHNKIMAHLNELCRSNGLEYPRIEVTNSGRPFEERELFDCVVTVGMLKTRAKSDCRFMARRLACKDMYNLIAIEAYPDMMLAIGSQCVGLARLRELGLQPLMSSVKRDWLKEHRTTEDGKMIHIADQEPDDGDMLDPNDVVMYEKDTPSS